MASIMKSPRGLGGLLTSLTAAALLTLTTTGADAAPQKTARAKAQGASNVSPSTDLVRRVVRSLETAGGDTRGLSLPTPVSDDDFRPLDPVQVELGKLLFHDKILSGNFNTSCATCHHMLADTSDGLSLPIGEGGLGLGPTREMGAGDDAIHERVPRNAPAIFNLGAFEFEVMMHDGRIAVDHGHPSGFNTPAGDALMAGLDSVLAAQACFPVTSATEMAGQFGENTIANAAAVNDFPTIWAILAQRVANIPEYVDKFAKAYPEVSHAEDITYAHIANAIAAYESAVGRADDSPFDRYLRGDSGAMSMNAVQGMMLFYGKAGCASCHSGSFQTNHSFAAIAMPQIGPGKGHNQPGFIDGFDDLGRGGHTGDAEENFKFRVPSLRNVALTGPWGHDGAYGTLEGVVRHHLTPVGALMSYQPGDVVLPYRDDLSGIDLLVMNTPERVEGIANACELEPVILSDNEVDHLIDFLHALTDTRSIDIRHAVPTRVPSGLPLYD